MQIEDGHNSEKEQSKPYTREEYKNIRNKIDKVLLQVKYPPKNEPDREKKIFSQIYKILGNTIDYDHNAVSDAEQDNERLQITCRNLFGGLIGGKCVCAGYADILRNTLACAGIYSEFVEGFIDFEKRCSYRFKRCKRTCMEFGYARW